MKTYLVTAVLALGVGAFVGCDSNRENVRDAQKDLADTQREAAKDGSTSATTRSAADVKVTAEQCARFAINKEVKPEDKALYEACSKIDEKKFR